MSDLTLCCFSASPSLLCQPLGSSKHRQHWSYSRKEGREKEVTAFSDIRGSRKWRVCLHCETSFVILSLQDSTRRAEPMKGMTNGCIWHKDFWRGLHTTLFAAIRWATIFSFPRRNRGRNWLSVLLYREGGNYSKPTHELLHQHRYSPHPHNLISYTNLRQDQFGWFRLIVQSRSTSTH